MNDNLKIKGFISKNIVVIIAWTLAIVSAFFVGIDNEYLNYFDVKTLLCLFSTMLVVGAYKDIRIFTIVANSLIKSLKNTRLLSLALIMITFFSSMFIANDMALLTFLPLTILVFKSCDRENHIAFTVIMQNIAANLGGMLTPFGNPQSLYLYNFFNIPTPYFVNIFFLPFALSLVLILLFSIFQKKETATVCEIELPKLHKRKTVLYFFLFVLAILAVFKVVNYLIASVIIFTTILLVDVRAYKKVDYGLMFTFVAFFIFSGNMARIPAVENFIKTLLEKSVLLTGVLSCQFFSNVPTAITLSKFTTNYAELLYAVNIGGCGTFVASLASLISLKEFMKNYKSKTASYAIKFLSMNYLFLGVLVALGMVMFYVK
ncbi:MAG: SLC13 family permease [Clostridia bacterium]